MASISPSATSRSTPRSTGTSPAGGPVALDEPAGHEERLASSHSYRRASAGSSRAAHARRVERGHEADDEGAHEHHRGVAGKQPERDRGDLVDVLGDPDQR